MISKGDFIVIKDLFKQGYSIRKIARLMKLDRKTVTRRLADESYQIPKRSITKESKLESYKPYILDFIRKSDKRIPYSVILDDIKDMGYTGSRSILQDFLTEEYSRLDPLSDPVIRFETLPGKQMQVDWTTIRHGKNPIYGFVATLGYSRCSFVYFTDNMETDTLIMCHEKAFLFFGGVTQDILYDNMKGVVITRNHYGYNRHKFNPKLLDFSKKHGFSIKLCKPYCPKTKGKVERFNSYLKANFYRPLVIKLRDAKLDVTHQILNQYLNAWLMKANERIHGTINRKPNDVLLEEHPHLTPYVVERKINAATTNEAVIKRAKELPVTIVHKSDLTEYDSLLLLGGNAA